MRPDLETHFMNRPGEAMGDQGLRATWALLRDHYAAVRQLTRDVQLIGVVLLGGLVLLGAEVAAVGLLVWHCGR